MRKYIFLALVFAIGLLTMPFSVFAATNDFVADADVTVANVTFGGTTADMLILNGSTAESFMFSSGAFTVTDPGSAFKVGSSDSAVKSMKITQNGSTLICAENSTPGTSFATLPTSSGTYTIEPSATTDCTSLCASLSNTASYNSFPTCGAANCDAGYTLVGTGAGATCVHYGGGGIFTGTLPNLPTPRLQKVYPDGTIEYLDEDTIAVAQAETTTTTTISAPSISNIFIKTLKRSESNSDIKRLQQLLNSDPDTAVATSGVGSAGNETNYFGSLTQKAVQKFQAKYGIVSSGTPDTTGYGLVGPKTRAKLAEIFGDFTTTPASIVATPSATAVSVSPVFNIGLSRGESNSNIKRLQQLLNSDPDTAVAQSGVGSAGSETNFFGSLTEKAVQKFQMKHGVVSSSSDAGYGYVGPKTRAKLSEIFGQ